MRLFWERGSAHKDYIMRYQGMTACLLGTALTQPWSAWQNG